jgi:hypothetical protein
MTWLFLEKSNCLELYFKHLCMIVTLMSLVDWYGYALFDTNISCVQFHI